MDKKIKIAMITSNLELNGISSVIMNYCKNIDKKKFEIVILAGSEVNEKIKEECKDLEIEIRELYSKRKSKLKYYISMFNAINKKEFDIFHVHGNSAIMAIDLMIAYFRGIKVRIAHSHNTVCSNPKIHRLLKPFFRRLYTQAFACGEDAGNWIFGKKNFCVINNGIQLEKFIYQEKNRKKIREKLNIKNDEFLIGHIGRINNQKNQLFLLDVFEKLCQRNDKEKLKLIFVGIGPLFEELKEKIKKSKYKDNIILYGETTETESFYMAIDIFAFPSRYEGLPVTLIEAQASGLKCLISDKITNEIILTNLITKISIDDEEIWINELEKYIKYEISGDSRSMNVDSFYKFDIKKNVRCLENYYKKFIKEV
jgi:glycosyltransferase involved in cell wall biosynthesis